MIAQVSTVLMFFESWNLMSKKIISVVTIFLLILAVGFILKQKIMRHPAETTLKKYFDATSWQEKLAYVELNVYPDLVQSSLKKHFENIDLSKGMQYTRFENLEGSNDHNGLFTAIKVITTERQNDAENRWYFLVKKNNGYLIDYTSTFGINQMTYKEMFNTKPTDSITKTVIAEYSSNSENELKNNEHQYLSLKLVELNTGESMIVQLRKLDIQTREMFYYLKGGKSQPFLLHIYFDEYLRSFSVAKVLAPDAPDAPYIE